LVNVVVAVGVNNDWDGHVQKVLSDGDLRGDHAPSRDRCGASKAVGSRQCLSPLGILAVGGGEDGLDSRYQCS
jgi:hypothetical protein